jgi:hypothetical protein
MVMKRVVVGVVSHREEVSVIIEQLHSGGELHEAEHDAAVELR